MNNNENGSFDTKIADVLRAIPGAIFAATLQDSRGQTSINVHAARDGSHRDLGRRISSALATVTMARVRIHFHRPARMHRAKSLEALASILSGDRVVYDPTGSFASIRQLLGTARLLRAELETLVCGIYFAPLSRTLYVALRRTLVERDGKLAVSTLARIEDKIAGVVRAKFLGSDMSAPHIRVGFGLPATRLVPVDQLSEQGLRSRVLDALCRYWKPVTLSALLGVGGSHVALGQDPAVSEPNFKLHGSFGEAIDDYTWNVEGAFTVPLGHSFGIQIEGGGGAQDGNGYAGAAGHVFMRDPESFMLGAFAAYSEGLEFDLDAMQLGGEFEFYLNQITISGSAGYQFSAALGDKSFGSFDIKWYASNNVALSGGVFGDEDKSFGRGRLEWQPGFAALPGLAFNINGVWGADDYQSITGGLTYYFGTPASLIDRHRRQDPESALFGLLQSVQREQAKVAERLCTQYGQC